MQTSPHRLLLTSVIRPFGGPGEGDSVGAELFHAQVTRAQGPFSLRQVIRVWALDYLAENVQTPTVTLHYPSEREFIRELQRENYTHIGINFVVATFHKVRQMVALIRKHAPSAKIILGGYGTVLPDPVLAPFSDGVCREEGVRYLRRELGEALDTPIRHPHAPIPSARILDFQIPTVVGHVTAGLGCSSGCDFCCTSHFFKQKYVPFSHGGRDLYETMMATRSRCQEEGQEMSGYIVIDEDFFLHRRRAMEFLECVREGGQALSIMGFGSVRGLSQFTAREVAEMGFDLIWNAFEGAESGYTKQRGKPLPELYRELKSVGCGTLTSMIIGFPYQDEATVWREFEALMALEPALVQCLIYFAFPGTPFHEQVIKEDRYRDHYQGSPDLRRWDGFSMHFKHPRFANPEKIEELQRAIYRTDFQRLGPSPLRLARVWLEGFKNLRSDDSPLLRQRAERLRRDARSVLPLISATVAFPPSPQVREQVIALRRDLIKWTGEPTATERALAAGAPAMYLGSWGLRKLRLLQQPGLLRTEHRTGGRPQTTQDAFRLQGGLSAGLFGALADDLAMHFRETTNRLSGRDPHAPSQARVDLTSVTSQPQAMPSSRQLPVLVAP